MQVTAPATTNFGPINIGSTSPVSSLVFTIEAAGTLGSVAVLTQGATGLDFADAGSDTCAANKAYTAGQTCTVNVTFTPRAPGTRLGAVVLEDGSGNALASGNLSGLGIGAQINFLPGAQSVLGSNFAEPDEMTVDSSGNLFVADFERGAVYELLAVNGSIPASPTINTLGSDFGSPVGVAIDGSGNVYVSYSNINAVYEFMAVNGSIPASPIINSLGSGFSLPHGIAVDGSGNVYIADQGNNAVKEILAVNGSIPASPVINTLGSGFSTPSGVAVDGSGNVYVADSGSSAVKEILAVNGSIPASSVINTLGSGFSLPHGIAVDGNGNVYVADEGSSAIYELLAVDGSIPASPVVNMLGSSLNSPGGVAVGSSGNVFIGNSGHSSVVELNFSAPPSLTFATAAVGTTSADSPQTVTVENFGNATLSFPIPTGGNNPSTPANFTLNSSGASACPVVSSTSSATGELAANASCQLAISFAPGSAGPYSGSLVLTDGNLNTAASSYTSQDIPLSGTVNNSFAIGSSTTSLTINQDGTVTSTITVTNLNGFTGNVTLSTSTLPSGMTAAFSQNPTTGTSVLTLSAGGAALGSYTITITGTSGTLTATSPKIALTVTPPQSIEVSALPASLSVNLGGSGTSAITVTDLYGFTGSVTLSAVTFPNIPGGPLPSGVTASFSPNPTTGSSVLTLNASSATTPGTYTLIIWGTIGADSYGIGFPLTVTSGPSFSLSDSPASLNINPGGSGTSTITVNDLNGFTGNVNLSAYNLPKGVTASFSPNPTAGTSVLTLNATCSVSAGSYAVIVGGNSGANPITIPLALTVSAAPCAVPTTTAVSISPSGGTLIAGTAYTVTAIVSPSSGSVTPTGNLVFTIGSATQTVALNSSGVATYNGTAPMAAGGLTISATYQGTAEFSASTSATLNETVLAIPTTTAVSISPSGGTLTAGSSYTLTATVAPSSGSTIPTGNLVFSIGSATQTVALNSSGIATYNGTAPAAAGGFTISAAYQGTAEFSASTSTTLNETVTLLVAPSFTVSGTTVIVAPGATTGNTSTITLTPSGAFTGSVALTAAITNSPSGAEYIPTLSFGATTPVSISGAAASSATLTITTTAATSAALVSPPRPRLPWYTAGGATMAFLLLFGIPARRRRWRSIFGMLALFAALACGVIACGGSASAPPPSNPGTTAGAYTITVTGTSGVTTATSAITLNVQ